MVLSPAGRRHEEEEEEEGQQPQQHLVALIEVAASKATVPVCVWRECIMVSGQCEGTSKFGYQECFNRQPHFFSFTLIPLPA